MTPLDDLTVNLSGMSNSVAARFIDDVIFDYSGPRTWHSDRRAPPDDAAILWLGPRTAPFEQRHVRGFAVIYSIDHCGMWWLDLLWTHPSFRRMGVASRVLEVVREHVATRGGTRLLAGVIADNEVMTRLLRHRADDGRIPEAWAIDHNVFATPITSEGGS